MIPLSKYRFTFVFETCAACYPEMNTALAVECFKNLSRYAEMLERVAVKTGRVIVELEREVEHEFAYRLSVWPKPYQPAAFSYLFSEKHILEVKLAYRELLEAKDMAEGIIESGARKLIQNRLIQPLQARSCGSHTLLPASFFQAVLEPFRGKAREFLTIEFGPLRNRGPHALTFISQRVWRLVDEAYESFSEQVVLDQATRLLSLFQAVEMPLCSDVSETVRRGFQEAISKRFYSHYRNDDPLRFAQDREKIRRFLNSTTAKLVVKRLSHNPSITPRELYAALYRELRSDLRENLDYEIDPTRFISSILLQFMSPIEKQIGACQNAYECALFAIGLHLADDFPDSIRQTLGLRFQLYASGILRLESLMGELEVAHEEEAVRRLEAHFSTLVLGPIDPNVELQRAEETKEYLFDLANQQRFLKWISTLEDRTWRNDLEESFREYYVALHPHVNWFAEKVTLTESVMRKLLERAAENVAAVERSIRLLLLADIPPSQQVQIEYQKRASRLSVASRVRTEELLTKCKNKALFRRLARELEPNVDENKLLDYLGLPELSQHTPGLQERQNFYMYPPPLRLRESDATQLEQKLRDELYREKLRLLKVDDSQLEGIKKLLESYRLARARLNQSQAEVIERYLKSMLHVKAAMDRDPILQRLFMDTLEAVFSGCVECELFGLLLPLEKKASRSASPQGSWRLSCENSLMYKVAKELADADVEALAQCFLEHPFLKIVAQKASFVEKYKSNCRFHFVQGQGDKQKILRTGTCGALSIIYVDAKLKKNGLRELLERLNGSRPRFLQAADSHHCKSALLKEFRMHDRGVEYLSNLNTFLAFSRDRYDPLPGDPLPGFYRLSFIVYDINDDFKIEGGTLKIESSERKYYMVPNQRFCQVVSGSISREEKGSVVACYNLLAEQTELDSSLEHHAIALEYNPRQKSFAFFDPNLGEYRFDSKTEFFTALNAFLPLYYFQNKTELLNFFLFRLEEFEDPQLINPPHKYKK